MPKVRRLAQAKADLDEIWLHIAVDNPAAADRLLAMLEAAEDRLAEFPTMAPLRADIRPDMRIWPVGAYLILYRADDGGVTIVRIVHGARDVGRLSL